jgi:hypothetical protein
MVRLYKALVENRVSLVMDTTKFNSPSVSFIFEKNDVTYTYSYPLKGLEEMGDRLIEDCLLIHLSDFLRYYANGI